MNVLVSGATGFIGSALCNHLNGNRIGVVRLIRGKRRSHQPWWDPDAGEIDLDVNVTIDAVIHLAGESIAEGRWTPAKKQRLLDSRVKGTSLLAGALAGLKVKPRVFVSASAIGYYGDRGDEPLTEEAAAGDDFLADVCRQWEAASQPAAEAGIRTVNPRIGVVLGRNGGALRKMLTPFKLGLGGPIGDGRQFMSWVALEDLVAMFAHVLHDEALSGPVNFTAPNAVSNREFTRTLGRVLHRPARLPMPAFAARLAFGEMAGALLLSGQRVVPAALSESGYAFEYPQLEAALRAALEES